MQRSVPSTLLAALLLSLTAPASAAYHPSYDPDLPQDTVQCYDMSVYNMSVPNPNDYIAEPIGQWPAWWREIDTYLRTLADMSDRVLLQPHGFTHEGRELYHLIISTPENLSKLETYRAAMDKVADPSQVSSAGQLDNLIADLPAFCWLAYSIHGDEVSGCDAAMRLAWHLAAAEDSATQHLLENLIILIEPSENPDGRERYLSMLQTYNGHVPNYDSRAMQHGGVWPWGRGNHYWFDLNRDWILLTQPETVGRVKSIVKYHPVLVVDGHEMGANATFLFSPPREPINYNTPGNVLKWYEVYGKDQATALDHHGWPYYTGEWNEQWYVGYGSAWPTFMGAVGILYEQAGVDGRFVRQRDDYLLTYHEAMNHQFTSSLANLATTANNREAILRDYHNTRRAIAEDGRSSGLSFIIAPSDDDIRMARFINSLTTQGIAVSRATDEFTVSTVTDGYRQTHNSKRFPAGTYIISTAQPHGALAKAILEFDLHLKKEFLEEERRELEKNGETRMYETSAWSVPLMYGLDAYYSHSRIQTSTEPVTEVVPAAGQLHDADAPYGYVIDMVGEKTYLILGLLFREKLTVYASEKSFSIGGRHFKPGALVVRRRGNPADLTETMQQLVKEVGIDVYGVGSGYSEEGSQLGAPTFRVLQQPRVALAAGNPLDFNSTGSLWFTIDKELEIPHSLLSMERIGRTDLSPYNVLIIPDAWGGALSNVLGKGGQSSLSKWVTDGGTLILVGSAAEWAADTANGVSAVRVKRQVLNKLSEFESAMKREIAAEQPAVDTTNLWHPDRVLAEQKTDDKGEKPEAIDETTDEWQRRFHPGGVIMQADVDTEHWLAFGLGKTLPVFVWSNDAWLAKAPVRTVARLTPDESRLRMSGLLWPEARTRWAGTAYTTCERKGQGQIVLFATDPTFRAYSYGSRQMLLNALYYGPGFTAGFEPYEQQH